MTLTSGRVRFEAKPSVHKPLQSLATVHVLKGRGGAWPQKVWEAGNSGSSGTFSPTLTCLEPRFFEFFFAGGLTGLEGPALAFCIFVFRTVLGLDSFFAISTGLVEARWGACKLDLGMAQARFYYWFSLLSLFLKEP